VRNLTPYACLDCGRISATKRCPDHGGTNRTPDTRPNWRQRGYGVEFDRSRRILLKRHPVCQECGQEPSVVADHHPASRVELVAAGVANPDALEHLRALGRHCHAVKSGGGK
jgi:5-methylcytosine-specific restriction protein A